MRTLQGFAAGLFLIGAAVVGGHLLAWRLTNAIEAPRKAYDAAALKAIYRTE